MALCNLRVESKGWDGKIEIVIKPGFAWVISSLFELYIHWESLFLLENKAIPVLKKGKTEVDDPNLSIINRFNNKMHKTQDVASLQANNRSLMQELEAMTIRHKAALQHN
jgi:hypothetical protein